MIVRFLKTKLKSFWVLHLIDNKTIVIVHFIPFVLQLFLAGLTIVKVRCCARAFKFLRVIDEVSTNSPFSQNFE